MKRFQSAFLVVFGLAALAAAAEKADPAKPPLGLPPLVVPEGNPQTPEKIALGEKLFDDKRFSSTGGVACATCHDAKKAFTDSPLATSEGILVKQGAHRHAQRADGRQRGLLHLVVLGRPLADLEDQAQHPFLNPVEMGLPNHDPRPQGRAHRSRVRAGASSRSSARAGNQITMKEVQQAIASFERTDLRRLALRSLLLRRRAECRSPSSEARLRPVRQQGPLRLVPRDRADERALHGQPLPQHRRRHQRHPERRAARSRRAFLKAKATRAEVDKTVLADKAPRSSAASRSRPLR